VYSTIIYQHLKYIFFVACPVLAFMKQKNFINEISYNYDLRICSFKSSPRGCGACSSIDDHLTCMREVLDLSPSTIKKNCTHEYEYIYMHICTCMYVCVCMCVYIYTYIHLYMCIYKVSLVAHTYSPSTWKAVAGRSIESMSSRSVWAM
jgi:hypothetical protein